MDPVRLLVVRDAATVLDLPSSVLLRMVVDPKERKCVASANVLSTPSNSRCCRARMRRCPQSRRFMDDNDDDDDDDHDDDDDDDDDTDFEDSPPIKLASVQLLVVASRCGVAMVLRAYRCTWTCPQRQRAQCR